MKKNKIVFKIVYSFLLITLIFSNSIGTAQALFGGGPSIPSTGEILDKVERHYGFDGNILRRSQKKADYPQAEIFFDNNDPEEGEKVTATALPKYFKNNNENLYYTWFLFREPNKNTEKAKQLAMGMVARGDFDPYLFGTDYSKGDKDPDKDGYDASYGGDDGMGGKKKNKDEDEEIKFDEFESDNYVDPVEKQLVNTTAISRCYRHNFGVSEPENYEINNVGGDLIIPCEHKFPEVPEGTQFINPSNKEKLTCADDDDEYEIGDGVFKTKEEFCWQLDPTKADTDGDGFVDEADLAGLGQTQLTWTFQEGDRVGLIIEGMSTVPINESAGITQVILDPKIVYSCDRATDDDNYCVDSDGEVGRCADKSCQSNTCAELSTDVGEPCVASGGDVGTCVSGGVGLDCVAVGDCNTSSSNGDLCEDENIAGVCQDSKCVIYRCGSKDHECQTDLGTLGTCNEIGLCEEDKVGVDDASINPYYKIMWAGLDFCDKEKIENGDKEELFIKDECDDENDYGFTYLATRKISQKNDSLPKTSLNFTPTEPQFNKTNPDYSNYITVKASFVENDVNDDFIYYDWDVYHCTENQIKQGNCTEKGKRLTKDCDENEVLGACSDLDGNKNLESDTYGEGMGVSQIKFRGSEDFSEDFYEENADEKFYFKVSLKTKENKNSSKMAISSVDIPVGKNDIDISLFDVDFEDIDFNEAFNEICNNFSDPDDTYNKICPVYTGQILGAAYSGKTEIVSAFWEFDGERLYLPQNNSWSLPTGYKSFIFFPIMDSGMEFKKITFKALTTDGEEIVSERIVSTAKPMIKKITSNDPKTAWPWEVDTGEVDADNNKIKTESENVLVAKIKKKISLKAETVPSYLDNTKVSYKWYLNNQEITTSFINNHPKYEISLNESKIKFLLGGEEGDSFNLKVEVIKNFTTKEKNFFKDTWGISNLKEIKTEKSTTVKQTLDDKLNTTAKGNSVRMFFASTFKNSPEYLIFIVKTAITIVLFWSFVYGLNYRFGKEVKITK